MGWGPVQCKILLQAVTTDGVSPKRRKSRLLMARQISAESATSDTLFFDVSSTRSDTMDRLIDR